MKLADVHRMHLEQLGSSVQLRCSCGWFGTLWSMGRDGLSDSSSTRLERILHLLENLELEPRNAHIELTAP